jgi:hypothetical protein
MQYLMVDGPLDGKIVNIPPEATSLTGPWPGTYEALRLSDKVVVFAYQRSGVAPTHRWDRQKHAGGFPAHA